MTLKYDENTKLIGGFSISKVYLGRTRFPYCLHHDYDDSLGWVSEAAITDLLEKPKVKIPQIVAEYLEKCKEEGLRLWLAIDIEVCPYLLTNTETFARAWLDGYDIEKEKLYTAKLKLTDEYLAYDNDNVEYYFTDKEMASKFTEEEFKKMKFWDNPAFKVEEAH